jgi:hypothetical protein
VILKEHTGVDMELHEIDLNLLVVFNQLLIDRRVSKAAESLGVSQPGVVPLSVEPRRVTAPMG